MKKKLLSFGLFILLIVTFCNEAQSQNNKEFKGIRYTFELVDSKNVSYSESELITDLSSIEGVFQCKVIKDSKKVVLYATRTITPPQVLAQLHRQSLGYKNFAGENIKVTNLDATTK